MDRLNWRRVLFGMPALTAAGAAIARAGDRFTTLEPGKTRVIEQEIPVNIVFVGYEEGAGDRDIDEAQAVRRLRRS